MSSLTINPNYWYHLSNAYAGEQAVLTHHPENTGRVVMAQLDMPDYWGKSSDLQRRGRDTGQLWRFVELPQFGEGWYRIHAKVHGEAKSLDCSQTTASLANSGPYTGQEWHIVPVEIDGSPAGPDWCHMTNRFIGDAKRLDSSKTAPAVGAAGRYLGQYWRLTAMDTVNPLPKPPADLDQFYAKYATTQGVHILGTSAVSDWAMLRVQNVVENIILSLKNPAGREKFRGQKTIVINKEDMPNGKGYPYLEEFGDFDFNYYRGGTRGDGLCLVVTEEMMCRTGVATRNDGDTAYREYDQIAHEWGHAINAILNLDSETEVFQDFDHPGEQIAWSVEKWFQTSFAANPDKSQDREDLKNQKLNHPVYKTVYDYLATIFDASKLYFPSPLYHKLLV